MGVSIYLGIAPAAPAGAAAASSECNPDCEPSPYVVRQLPAPAETPTHGIGDASDIKAIVPLLADSMGDGPEDIEPAPAQSYLRLSDAAGDERIDGTGQGASLSPTQLRPTPAFSLADTLPPQKLPGEPAQIADSAGSPAPLRSAESPAAESNRPVTQLEEILEYGESYTATDQLQPPPAEAKVDDEVEAAADLAYSCPATSGDHFELIPIEGRLTRDHPAAVHGDLNLVLRGYIPTRDGLELVDYSGDSDPNAPQLAGLFEPNRLPHIRSVYRVNDWNWDSSQCGGHPRGCPAPPADSYWQVTLVGLAATPGEPIYVPERSLQIYRGGYVALVLYAEKQRITLGYTRRDHVASGYVVHLEDVCVNPNLIALYQAQLDGAGWNDTGQLPALRNNQALGTALNAEVKAAIRDAGSFMDPRSRKDWWK